MRIALFCHSILSDWNHGNAHFLRGLVSALAALGHRVRVYEPHDAWSVRRLLEDADQAVLEEVRAVYPALDVVRYGEGGPDLDAALEGVGLVLVHEWSDPAIVAALGKRRSRGGRFRLFFHDTHHRSVSAPRELARYDLSGFDGVLAFGEAVREVYLRRGWGSRVWTWHEAADCRVFHPIPEEEPSGDLVWIGNWGDEERTAELRRFLIGPARRLRLRALVHGVRYPEEAVRELASASFQYRGWIANFHVPRVFARHRVTVHVPRRPYVAALPGIPTIRVFEALACGIPLIAAQWSDPEGLFLGGRDFLSAGSGPAMERALRDVLCDEDLAASLSRSGLETILSRHTCSHRAKELLAIARGLGADSEPEPAGPKAAATL